MILPLLFKGTDFTATDLRAAAWRGDIARGSARPRTARLIEWPEKEKEPIKYRLSILPDDTTIEVFFDTAKMRWRIEHDYEERANSASLISRGEVGEHSITTPASAWPPMDS